MMKKTEQALRVFISLGFPSFALGGLYLLFYKFSFRFATINSNGAAIIAIVFLVIVGGVTYFALEKWAPQQNQTNTYPTDRDIHIEEFSSDELNSLLSEALRAEIRGDLGEALEKLKEIQSRNPNFPGLDRAIKSVERELEKPWVRHGKVIEDLVLRGSTITQRNKIQIGSLQIPTINALTIISAAIAVGIIGVTANLASVTRPATLAFSPASENEVLIVIATFHHPAGVRDRKIHEEIQRQILQAADSLVLSKLRVEVEPTIIEAESRDQAAVLGKRYNADIVIWGTDTGTEAIINILTLGKPIFSYMDGRGQPGTPDVHARFSNGLQLTSLALFVVGQSYYLEGRYSETTFIIERVLQLTVSMPYMPQSQDLVAAAYNILGLAHYYQGEYNLAINVYTQAIRLDSNLALVYNNLGLVYAAQGEYNLAINVYTQAIRLDSNLALVYNNLGLVYAAQGEYNQAINVYTQAIRLHYDPLSFPYIRRGYAYDQLGATDKAIADYRRALEIGGLPDSLRQQVEQRLRVLGERN